MQNLLLILPILAFVNGNVCPNGKECPSHTKCCQLLSGMYGCCPYVNGSCCSDRIHCCPSGLKCNVKAGSCDADAGIPLNWMVKLYPRNIVSSVMLSPREESLNEAPIKIAKDINCPDDRTCPSDNTCCKMPAGNFGCCPYEKATCCTDREHCCPQGYNCNVTLGICDKHVYSPEVQKIFLVKLNQNLKDIPVVNELAESPLKNDCPDRSHCGDTESCCRMAQGSYGCCPYEKATCCPDLLHCCPQYFTCDYDQCIANNPGKFFLDVISPKPLKKNNKQVLPVPKPINTHKNKVFANLGPSGKDVVCPDKKVCTEGSTCCATTSDSDLYACCPMENASCCSDHLHCCPDGYECDMVHMGCVAKIKLFESIPAIRHSEETLIKNVSILSVVNEDNDLLEKDVICQDKTVCIDGSTCCLTPAQNGSYACCPMRDASCCSDHIHCCSHGYVCDMVNQSCVPKKGWSKSLPLIRHSDRTSVQDDFSWFFL